MLKKINFDTLNPGDEVGVPISVEYGYGKQFRYEMILLDKVKRITPKRTKIIMESGREFGKYDMLYELDEEAIRQTRVAKAAKNVSRKIFELSELKGKHSLFQIDDDTILSVSRQLTQLVDEINKALEEKQKG